MQNNTITPIHDQAAYRINFPAKIETLTGWERRLIREIIEGDWTKELS